MPLNYKEMSRVMRTIGMTNTQIAEVTSVGVRNVSSMYNGHSTPRKPANFERLALKSLSARIAFPWPLDAAIEMISLREMGAMRDQRGLVNNYEFSARVMINATLCTFSDPSFDPQKVDEDTWGSALLGFFFILAMRGIRSSAIQKDFYKDEWEVLVKGLEDLLGTLPPEDEWVKFLRIKVAAAKFNVFWNALDKKNDERSSEDTRAWVSRTNVRALLLEYNDMIPHDVDAPFTAMAIASRFKDREAYSDIQSRLTAIDPSFGDPTSFTDKTFLSKYPEFDEDFADFVAWANNQQLKEAS